MGKKKEALIHLEAELCKLQDWLKDSGERAIVIFEGRDTAGKGGMIKTIQKRVSHRVFRSVALPKPTTEESTQWYFQRYVTRFPSAGEIILFDRSWYNRAGVERVMGFCSEEQVQQFFSNAPDFERAVVSSGIKLIKYWLEIDPEVQEKRLTSRLKDPRKHWKLSPMDLKARSHWHEYTRARDDMFRFTHTQWAPWFVVPSNDKDSARLNCITHLLGQFDYENTDYEAPDIEKIPPIGTSNPYRGDAQNLAQLIPQPWDSH